MGNITTLFELSYNVLDMDGYGQTSYEYITGSNDTFTVYIETDKFYKIR